MIDSLKTRPSLLFLLIIVSLVNCFNPITAYAAAENEYEKSITFHSEDKDEQIDDQFEEVIFRQDSRYVLQAVNYEVSPVIREVDVSKSLVSDPMPGEYVPDKEIVIDGVIYKLESVEEKEITVQSAFSQEVNATTEFDSQISEGQVPKTKDVRVKDNLTGETVTVTCDFKELKQGSVKNIYSNIPIRYENYDSYSYVFQGTEVPASGGNPLAGYENLLLESVGFDPNTTQILSLSWNGDAYESDGVMYRDAIAMIQRQDNTYTASYTGNIQHPEEMNKIYTANYAGIQKVETKDFEITATATYEFEEIKGISITKVLGGIGIGLFLILVILVLYIISKKRRRKQK